MRICFSNDPCGTVDEPMFLYMDGKLLVNTTVKSSSVLPKNNKEYSAALKYSFLRIQLEFMLKEFVSSFCL